MQNWDLLELPPPVIEFLKRPNPAVIACIRPGGFPMTVATWYDWEDGLILVNMHEGRSRLRWMRTNPKVSLTALGHGRGSDWYRHVSLYGSVIKFAGDSALTDIDGWHGWDDSGEVASTDIRT